jgi:hypothetical protein
VLASAEPTAWRAKETPAPVWDWLEDNHPGESKRWDKLDEKRQKELLEEADSRLHPRPDSAALAEAPTPPPPPPPASGWSYSAVRASNPEGASAAGAVQFDRSGSSPASKGASWVSLDDSAPGSAPPVRRGAKTLPPPTPEQKGPIVVPEDPVYRSARAAWEALSDRTRSGLLPGVPVPAGSIEKSAMKLVDLGVGTAKLADTAKGVSYDARFASWIPVRVNGTVDLQTNPAKPKVDVDASLSPAAQRQLAASFSPAAPPPGTEAPPAPGPKQADWAVRPNVKVGLNSLMGAAFTLDSYGTRVTVEGGARVGVSGAAPESKVKVEDGGVRVEATQRGADAKGVQLAGGYNRDGTVFSVRYNPASGKAGAGVEQDLGKGWTLAGQFERGSGDMAGLVVLRSALGSVFF